MKSKEEKIKEYDILLHKYITNKEFVKINRSIYGEECNLSGFILKITNTFLLFQNAEDFSFDGYAIIEKDKFDSIRCGKYDKAQKKIYKAEGLIKSGYGFEENISLDNWASIFKQLKKLDYHVIIEDVKSNDIGFFIGEIVKVSRTSVSILNYDPAGLVDEEPMKIQFNKIWSVYFGDRYSSIFRKYLKYPK